MTTMTWTLLFVFVIDLMIFLSEDVTASSAADVAGTPPGPEALCEY